MKEFKAFWINSNNVGDTLTPVIVEHFTGYKLENVHPAERRKLIAVGSTMRAICSGDTIWGTGIMREDDLFSDIEDCRFLAVRGKLTEEILGVSVGVYGDPALLLSLMYKPANTKKYKLGIIPHYAEQDEPIFFELAKQEGSKIIDVMQNWKTFVNEVVSCEEIISSSLHGIVISLAYGIKCKWIKPTQKVAGNGFKFRDFGSGVGIKIEEGMLIESIPNLYKIQQDLIKALVDNL